MSLAASRGITALDIEREIVSRSFLDFLGYVKILEPPPGRGVIEFELWPHLVELAEGFGQFKLLDVVKAKQIGVSWELAAFSLWTAMYHDGAAVLEYSRGELESRDLLSKSKFILDHLPCHLQEPLRGEGNLQELVFPRQNSNILALPSTKAAGIGRTATLVVMDEADFHEFLAENYDTAAKPTVDAGGQLIMASTINPSTMVSTFKDIVRGSGDREAGSNGFARYFYPYVVRPGRDEKWYESGLSAAVDRARFQKNYPRSLEEALEPAQALAAFDLDILKLMGEDRRGPIDHLGVANIYQGFAVGKRYVAFTDNSHGTGGDDAVTVVMDVATGYIVADIQSNVISPEELAYQSDRLVNAYECRIWGIEDNDWGILTIRKAQEIGNKHLYERKEGVVGWHTDEKNRYLLWGELIEAVRSRLIVVPSREGLAQFTTVIRNPEKGGRIEAMQGTHDDYPTAVGGAWQMRKYAHGGVVKLRSLTYAGM